MSERPCLLHVGTHKTGTTSIQVFLQENAPAFAAAGVRIAQTGRFKLVSTTGAVGATPGNHELAWDLVADETAKLAELVQELRECGSRSAIVSSEDFSLLYARPAMLETLAEHVRDIGYVPKIAVYLRAQAAYAESMYVERIKHGHVKPIAAYVRTILEEGRYLPEGTRQDIAFSYVRLIEPFERVFGPANLFVRAYAPKEQTDIFRDFLEVLSTVDPPIARQELKLVLSRPRENESLSFGQLLWTLFVTLQPDAATAYDGARFLQEFAPDVPLELASARFALLQREEHLAFLERFASENARVAREYGAAVPFTVAADVAPAEHPVWEKARLERAVFDRCLQAWSGAAV
ncbi:MAG: hypothetical protein JO029_09395 [Candidatus Eremiobacteraeota bacterium]|nr:hypothetical protein [Candidatus Eremiobacteraeota bacterium]